MKITIIIIIILAITGLTMYLLKSNNEDNVNINNKVSDNKEVVNKNSASILTYKDILPAELDSILLNKDDIFLLDVHTPEQKHIDGTDTFIPYDNLENNISQLPKDKNQKIVVYCRSGSMSKIASEKLIELGFTNVSNLDGGIKAWNSYQENK